MTNTERKAVWLEVVKHLAKDGFSNSAVSVRVEADRRFPTIKITKTFAAADGFNYRCIERDGRRVLQLQFMAERGWEDCYPTRNDAVVAAVLAPFDQEEDA